MPKQLTIDGREEAHPRTQERRERPLPEGTRKLRCARCGREGVNGYAQAANGSWLACTNEGACRERR